MRRTSPTTRSCGQREFPYDAQLPPALARWIASQGHQATHVFDIGLQSADDPAIWERARRANTVIISKDEDFVDHWLLSADPVQFVWIRKGNCSNRALLDWLEPLWPDAVKRLEQGEKFIELRG
jgi:predicted nuclease of predicted toxin-antitoxin system